MYGFSKRGFSALIREAVEIYRGPNRLSFYRGFGLFCLGHTALWAGLTYYQGWYKDKEREDILRRFAELRTQIRTIFLRSSARVPSDSDKTAAAVVATDPAMDVKRIELDPEGKSFLSSILAQLDTYSRQTKKFDKTLIPVFTASFGVFTFAMGIFLPRRIVRRLTLLPGTSATKVSSSSPHTPSSQLVEIETYGAFGFRAEGVRFQVPIERVHAMNARTDNMQFLQFYINKVPFRFIMEKNGADFRNPHEYDFIFAADRH